MCVAVANVRCTEQQRGCPELPDPLTCACNNGSAWRVSVQHASRGKERAAGWKNTLKAREEAREKAYRDKLAAEEVRVPTRYCVRLEVYTVDACCPSWRAAYVS